MAVAAPFLYQTAHPQTRNSPGCPLADVQQRACLNKAQVVPTSGNESPQASHCMAQGPSCTAQGCTLIAHADLAIQGIHFEPGWATIAAYTDPSFAEYKGLMENTAPDGPRNWMHDAMDDEVAFHTCLK